MATAEDILGPKPKTAEDILGPKPEKPTGQRVLEAARPTIEAAGAMGGAVLGAPFGGPVGSIAGAGLGYGLSSTAVDALSESLGYSKPSDKPSDIVKKPLQKVISGAAYETGGQLMGPTIKGLTSAYQWGKGLFPGATTKAARIASQSLGPNLIEARKILKAASDDLTASQALAVIDSKTGKAILDAPTTQALLQRAQSHDPEFFTKMFGTQEAKRIADLQRIANGTNQTEARIAREEMKKALNERLIPTLKTELEAANTAGKLLPKLQAKSSKFADAAERKVEDVRRFNAAGKRAAARAKDTVPVPGQPRVPGKYTYMGELAERADKVAADAAEGSLRFGEARDFAQAAAQSLEAHGLRPLTGDAVISRISAKLRDPQFAGNEDMKNSLIRVAEDIKQWTNAGGVIDAFALDSIRKNSVNAAIQKMYPAADRAAQKKLASVVLENIKPVIIDAIEGAGGTGYREYLKNYTIGSQVIAQSKLGANLMHLYETSPKEFVRLVQGNRPDEIEKVFGPGSYNVFKEMSDGAQRRLSKIASDLTREEVIKEQAKAGSKRLEDVLKTNIGGVQLPHILSRKVTIVNTVLDELEGKVSEKTMVELTRAAKSAKNLDELLSKLPSEANKEVLSKLVPPVGVGGVAPFTKPSKNRE